MKKIISFLLTAVMCFSLAACGGSSESDKTANNDPIRCQVLGEKEVENGSGGWYYKTYNR